jgi:hypothetical protein
MMTDGMTFMKICQIKFIRLMCDLMKKKFDFKM